MVYRLFRLKHVGKLNISCGINCYYDVKNAPQYHFQSKFSIITYIDYLVFASNGLKLSTLIILNTHQNFDHHSYFSLYIPMMAYSSFIITTTTLFILQYNIFTLFYVSFSVFFELTQVLLEILVFTIYMFYFF